MDALSPWQSLPDFLAQRLVQVTIEEELRPLHVALRRLVSRGWRQAVDEGLPVLAPRPLATAAEAAAVAACCPGLLVLRMQCKLPEDDGDEAGLSADRAAALAAISAGCPSLRSLSLLDWHYLTDAAMQPLPALSQLHSLRLDSGDLLLGTAGFSALRQLPRLRALELRCRSVNASGLATMSLLTSLDLTAPDGGVALVAALTRLPGLRHLGIKGLSKAAWGRLTHLTVLSSLTSVSLNRTPQAGAEPAQVLLALLSGFASRGQLGGADNNMAGLRRVDVVAWAADAAPPLALHALARLECLRLEYKGLQIAPVAQVTCLAGLTELRLDVRQLGIQYEEEEVNAFVAVVARRLTALRRLSLQHADHVSGPALQCLSGLNRLTELSLTGAHEFGEQALSALIPLTDLRRLSLSHASLTAADVEAVLAPAGEDPAQLLPHLTYLFFSQCQLLGGPGLQQLAAALPSLQWLVHRGSPFLQRQDLHTILLSCHSLRLLQTSWLPAEPPSVDTLGAAALFMTAAQKDNLLQQQLQRCLEDRAFCHTWRFCLQPGLPTGGQLAIFQAEEAVAAYYAFDAADALRKAQYQRQPR